MTLRPGWDTQRDLASKGNKLEKMVQYYEDLLLFQRTGVWILACTLGTFDYGSNFKGIFWYTHTPLKTNK